MPALVAQWDAAQAEGRTAQAHEVFQRVRAEVDAGYADFEAAARGRHGVRVSAPPDVARGMGKNTHAAGRRGWVIQAMR